MKSLKIAAIVLCALLIAVAATGNGFKHTDWPDSVTDSGSPELSSDMTLYDFEAAMEAFPPDTVMLSYEDFSVSWGVFYFFLHNTVAQLTSGFTEVFDWHEPSYTGQSWGELVKTYVIDQASNSLVFDYGLSTTGTQLSEYDIENLQLMVDMMIDDAESIEALEADLRLDGIYSLDVYRQLLTSFTLQDKLPAALYGSAYNEIDDSIVAQYAEQNGFMQAKHILLSFPPEGDEEELSAEESEAAKSDIFDKITEIHEQLLLRADDDDFQEFFSELMLEHSEDPGSMAYPDGYLFQYTDMVEPFSAACMALEPGQMSDIVETDYGYHIILRLPIDFDYASIPDYNTGQLLSLRMLAVYNDYDNKLNQWFEMMTIVHSPQLEALSVAELFVANVQNVQQDGEQEP